MEFDRPQRCNHEWRRYRASYCSHRASQREKEVLDSTEDDTSGPRRLVEQEPRQIVTKSSGVHRLALIAGDPFATKVIRHALIGNLVFLTCDFVVKTNLIIKDCLLRN